MGSRLIGLLVVLAVAYWYYTESFQSGQPSMESRQVQENTQAMKKCMRREATMTAASGMAGAGSDAGDTEKLCAGQLGLYKDSGQWQKY